MYPSNAYVMTISFCFSDAFNPIVTVAKEYNPEEEYEYQIKDIIEVIRRLSNKNPHINSVKFLREMYHMGYSDRNGDFDMTIQAPGYLNSINIFCLVDGEAQTFQVKDHMMQDIRSLQRYL
jgi:hypothetical protein